MRIQEKKKNMNRAIHPLTEADVEATDAVLRAAYQTESNWHRSLHRLLTVTPGGALVARQNDTIVGFGAAIDYRAFAYIGSMAVHPLMQQRGIGRLILEHLLAQLVAGGCSTVLLDASRDGAPLYERCGFIDDDSTLVLQRQEETRLTNRPPGSSDPLPENALPELVAFDVPCFGGERAALLTSYWADDPHRVLVRRDAHGQMAGYLIAQSRTIGPWVARTGEAAEWLLLQALTLPFQGEPVVLVSASHQEALHLLRTHGFGKLDSLRHMRQGDPVPRGRQTTLYGQASLGLG
jgi:predicted N-acetyltransferase YhbS